jgi:hypothetical protein
MRRISNCKFRITDFSLKRWMFLLLAGVSTFSLSIYGEETPIITVSEGDKITLTVSLLAGNERGGCDQDVTETGNKGFATTKIAFIATRGGKKEVYVADYDGTNVHQLTHDGVISAHPYSRSTGRKGKLRVVLLRARLSSLPTKLAIILAHEPHPLTPVLAFWAEVRI